MDSGVIGCEQTEDLFDQEDDQDQEAHQFCLPDENNSQMIDMMRAGDWKGVERLLDWEEATKSFHGDDALLTCLMTAQDVPMRIGKRIFKRYFEYLAEYLADEFSPYMSEYETITVDFSSCTGCGYADEMAWIRTLIMVEPLADPEQTKEVFSELFLMLAYEIGEAANDEGDQWEAECVLEKYQTAAERVLKKRYKALKGDKEYGIDAVWQGLLESVNTPRQIYMSHGTGEEIRRLWNRITGEEFVFDFNDYYRGSSDSSLPDDSLLPNLSDFTFITWCSDRAVHFNCLNDCETKNRPDTGKTGFTYWINLQNEQWREFWINEVFLNQTEDFVFTALSKGVISGYEAGLAIDKAAEERKYGIIPALLLKKHGMFDGFKGEETLYEE